MASHLSVVGTSPPKVDGVDKVTGAAKYAADIMLPDMLYGKILRSPHPHAQVLSIDTTTALQLDGVKAVLTVDDVPRVLHAGAPAPRLGAHAKDQYIFDHKVRHVGDGVAAVAAVSEQVADEALDLIKVEYEPLPAVFDVEKAMQPGAPKIHGTDRNLVMPPILIEQGDLDRGFEEADHVFEGVYRTGRPAHCYMEPNACVCRFDKGGRLTIWASTQTPFMVRGILSEVLNIPLSRIRVIVEHMGGGFGGKQDLYQHEFVCALLAQETGRPVKMEYTREECFLGGRTRHPVTIHLKQGVRRDGRLVAREMRYISNSGAYGSHGPGITAVGCYDSTSFYRCENVRIEGLSVYTNNPIAGAFRGYGAVQAYFALDSQMDEIAHALGIDPVELRLRNAVGEGDLTGSGVRLRANGIETCLRRGAVETRWLERKKEAPKQDGGLRRGWGVGVELHPSGTYPTIKELSSAILEMNEDGTASLLTGVADLGTGAQTAMAQIAAEELGIPFSSIRVVAGDTDIVPFDLGAFASRTTYVAGGAVVRAAADLKAQLLALAAEKLETPVEDLTIRDGQVFPKSAPEREMPIKDVVQATSGVPGRTLIGSATNEPEVDHSFAAHFAEVEVDTETGRIDVLQVVAVHEVGQAINPIGVEGQIEGGIQQGIGHTLMEDLIIDQETGGPLNANLVDYKMPLALDMPKIRTIILEETPGLGAPFGAKGVGEDPILAIGQAIANAVHDAIGVRMRDMPFTPERVLQALREKRRADEQSQAFHSE
ncbi:xanthine dehydrogenase family protein molybdopterin-binding subunit [Chloroflexota bacterium]